MSNKPHKDLSYERLNLRKLQKNAFLRTTCTCVLGTVVYLQRLTNC